jgi:hypothetical protein
MRSSTKYGGSVDNSHNSEAQRKRQLNSWERIRATRPEWKAPTEEERTRRRAKNERYRAKVRAKAAAEQAAQQAATEAKAKKAKKNFEFLKGKKAA